MTALMGKTIVGHNMSFDMAFLHRIGWVPTGPVKDTMVLAYLLDELRKSLSLASCCVDYKVAEKKGDDLYKILHEKYGAPEGRESMSHFWLTNAEDFEVHDYASGDGTSTWQLYWELERQIDRVYYSNATGDYSLRRIETIETDLIPVVHDMRMKGIKVDEERLWQLTTKFKREVEEADAKLNGINVKSPLAMVKYFTDHGVKDWPTTPTGRPSFPEEWLVKSESGRAIVAVRKNRTLLASFLDPISNRFLYKGRVHAQIHQTRDEHFGTKTGRMSITDPNLSAMPGKRQGDLGQQFRSIFVADDGYEFTEADYSTCEIRICAHYCGAKVWVDGYRRGIDPHTSVSNSMGIVRRHSKTINLALMTGSGKNAITEKLGLPMAEGHALVDQYFSGLPELKTFQRQSAAAFKSRGFISTIGGRRLQLDDPRRDYTALNRLTQGGNADLTKLALVKIGKIKEITLSTAVHDSVLSQHEKGNKEARFQMLRAMVDAGHELGFKIPMGVEYGTGPSWAEATFTVEGKIDDAIET
jgi:DNA polymerase-1